MRGKSLPVVARCGAFRKVEAVRAGPGMFRRGGSTQVTASQGSRGLVCRVMPRHGRRGLSAQGSQGAVSHGDASCVRASHVKGGNARQSRSVLLRQVVAMAASQVNARQSWFGRSWSGGASHGELREARQSSQGAGGTASRGGYGMEAQGSRGPVRLCWLCRVTVRQRKAVRVGPGMARRGGSS